MKKMYFSLALLFLAIASFAQNVPAYVPTNGLVGWWPFNGNANDESGNGNNGTVNGATLTSDRFGNAGKAYDFDGISNFISLQNAQFTNEITISYWINIPTNGGGTVIVQNTPIPPFNTSFQLSNVPNNFQQYILYSNNCNSSQNYYLNQSTSIANNWHNLVYSIDINSDCKLFFDGIFQGTYNGVNFTNCSNTSTNLRFGGKWISNDPQWFNGQLDDIGIWNRALTQQEITDLYNGNICYQTITVTDTLRINTGITGFNPVTYENTIRIWPNPINDHITIDAGDLNVMNGYNIRIVNALGQQVFQTALTQQQYYLDLSTWTGSGIYYVNIINPQGVTIDTRKIVIQ